VNLHTAVGVGNAMGAIVNAALSHSPLVITTGQQVRAMLTMQPFLANPDATALPKPAVKWAFEPPRAQDVPAALARAFRYAALPPAAPVFVSLPMDDFAAPAEPQTTDLLAARRLNGGSLPADRIGRARKMSRGRPQSRVGRGCRPGCRAGRIRSRRGRGRAPELAGVAGAQRLPRRISHRPPALSRQPASRYRLAL
jgi:thiamine pyrophosphate-dependent acetolactate synthase large subunit-like protein